MNRLSGLEAITIKRILSLKVLYIGLSSVGLLLISAVVYSRLAEERAESSLFTFLGVFGICFFLFFLLERFVYYFNFKLYKKVKIFILAYSVILFLLLLARFFIWVSFPEDSLLHIGYFPFLIPIPIASMILSMMITPNISLLTGTIIGALVSVMVGGDFFLFLYLFLSNCVTAFVTYRRFTRSDLIRSGFIIGLFNMGFIAIIGLFKEEFQFVWYGLNVGFGFINGLVSSMITLAVLPYLEILFKITTAHSLLELTNLNHPILKKMMMTAPGTYQHSLMVANLSEAAGEAIQVDPILCRAGAYFHDIGKIKRPMFFTENQFGKGNPHEMLTPRLSKLIIAAHIKDGIEIANRYKIPDAVKDFILEHHGTCLVSFFYARELHRHGEAWESVISEEEFRYPGPKVHSKETGIVMLADTVEAAIRSMEKPTPHKIEALMDKLIGEKIEDGQLNECPLSLKEIDSVKKTFVNVFRGIYHSRVDYQKELNTLENKDNSDFN